MAYRIGALLVGLLLSISGVGCKSMNHPRIPASISRQSKNIEYTPAEFNTDRTSFIEKVGSAPTMPVARRIRDSMVMRKVGDIDYFYSQYETTLSTGRATYDTLADVTELGVALATTISNGERVKTVLAAALTAFKGVRTSIDKNFFREQTLPIIIKEMQALRSAKKLDIVAKLTARGPDSYGFDEASNDVGEYFYAGTLYAGLGSLTESASTKANENRSLLFQMEAERGMAINQLQSQRESVAAMRGTNNRADAVRMLGMLGKRVDESTSDKDVFEMLERELNTQANPRALIIEAKRLEFLRRAYNMR
jgi:hypothetical protein